MGRPVHDSDGLRGYRAADGERPRRDVGRAARLHDAAVAGRLLGGGADAQGTHRLPRPARRPAPVHRHVPRRVGRRVGVLRVGPHRRETAARAGARRGGADRQRGPAQHPPRSRGPTRPLLLRVHLLRPPRQHSRRQAGACRAARDGAATRGGVPCRRGHGHGHPGLGHRRGHGVRGGLGGCRTRKGSSRTGTWDAPSSSRTSGCANSACG